MATVWACNQQASADVAVQQAAQSSSSSWFAHLGHLLPLSIKQRVFFTYEKRIRDLSSLDKVFMYFSSQERNNNRFMLPEDMLHAIVPTYPPSQSLEERAGALAGERRAQHHRAVQEQSDKFFQQFDLDGDGLMDLSEFQLVVTLLSIPQRDVQVIFDVVDLDGNGFIDSMEFQAIMRMLQGQAGMRRQAVVQAGTAAVPPSGLLVSFFGPHLSGKLDLKQFREFLSSLQNELVKLEFHHYLPNKDSLIPGIDFARSLVVAAEVGSVDHYLRQVDKRAEQLSKVFISLEEFQSVAQMQQDLHALRVALEFMDKLGRPVGQEELGSLVYRFCGVKLSRQVLEVMLLVFGRETPGTKTEVLQLDSKAFLEVMRRKGSFWARRG